MIKAYLQIVIIIQDLKNHRDLKKLRDVKNGSEYTGKKGNPIYLNLNLNFIFI